MNIGKREQIVIGVISALGLIAGLHYWIFAKSSEDLVSAKTERDAKEAALKAMVSINDQKKVDDYDKQTIHYLDNLDDGLKTLKVEEPEIFAMTKLADVTPKPGDPPFPPPIPTPPPNWRAGRGMTPWPTPYPPEKEPRRKRSKEIADERAPEQLSMILAEIEKLRVAQAARKPELTFLDFKEPPPGYATQWSGWRMPTELPAEMAGGALGDALKEIANYRTMVDSTAKSSTLLQTIQGTYNNFTLKIGLDLEFCSNLRKYGPLVPLIHKLFYVNLIMKRVASTPGGMIIESTPLNAMDLCHYLDADLEYTPLDGITESKAYFLYEQLKELNYMIEMARKLGVKQISEVTFRGYAYLRPLPNLIPETTDAPYPNPITLTDDEMDGASGSDAELPDGYTMDTLGKVRDPQGNIVDPQTLIVIQHPEMFSADDPILKSLPPLKFSGSGSITPKSDELGYAIPIKMSYVASNAVGINYIWSIMRDKPLAELHRLIIRSMSANWDILTPYYSFLPGTPDPTSNDLEFSTTIVFVPKLFTALDTVRTMIKEIRSTSSTTARGAVAAAPPAKAGAAK